MGCEAPSITQPDFASLVFMGLAFYFALVYYLQRARRDSWVGLVRKRLRLRRAPASVDAMEMKFREAFESARREYTRQSLLCMGLCHTIAMLFLVVTEGLALPRDERKTRWQFLVWSSLSAFYTAMNMFPSIHIVRGFPLAYCLGIIFCCCFVLPFDHISKDDIMLINMCLTTMMTMCGPFCGLVIRVVGSVTYCLVVTASFTFAAGTSVIDDRSFLSYQFSAGLFVILVVPYLFSVHLASSVRAAIESEAVIVEHKAFSSLLDITCDAVAELDEIGMILSPCPKLASLLLLQGQSVEGALLQRFMVSERDRQIFDEGLTTDGPRLLCVEMRDSTGGPIKVELYHVPFKSAENKKRFLVGVKEYADAAQSAESGLDIGFNMRQTTDGSHETSSEKGDGDQDTIVGGSDGPTRLTKNLAMDLTLLNTMASWKFRLRGKRCCTLHEGVRVLRNAVGRLARMRCNPGLGFGLSDWQCPDCGIADEEYKEDDGSCFVCLSINRHFPGWAIKEEPRRERRGHGSPRSRRKEAHVQIKKLEASLANVPEGQDSDSIKAALEMSIADKKKFLAATGPPDVRPDQGGRRDRDGAEHAKTFGTRQGPLQG